MAPKTRYFLVGSALVVVVGVCTGLVAYYGGSLPGRTAARVEFRYLPADASAVAYANVADIMGSEFSQQVRRLLPTGEDKARFEAETGIDIERDIDAVTVAMSGEGAVPGGTLVVVRGRFDAARIESLVFGHGATPVMYRDVKILSGPEAGDVQTVPGLALLGDGLIAVGTRRNLQRAIDAAADGDSASGNGELMDAVAGIEGSGNAWFVGRTEAVSQHQGMPDLVRRQLTGVRWLAVGADIQQDVRARLRAETDSDQAAADLRGVVNGLISAARLMAASDPRLQSALSSVQTSGTGSSVEIEFTVPADLVELARDMHKLGGGLPAH
jgi:hypothetical protein